MEEGFHLETEVSIQKYEIASVKDMLVKMDLKLDGMQNFMNKLYEIFVTQKDLQDFTIKHEKEHTRQDEQIRENKKEIKVIRLQASFISGIGFLAVLLKDVIIDAIFKSK